MFLLLLLLIYSRQNSNHIISINIVGRLRNRTPRNVNVPDDEDISDPEDNKPLRAMVNETPIRTRPHRNSTRHSDEHTGGTNNSATSSTRSSRTQKRPHYNEDSDEDEEYTHQTKRRVSQTPAGRYG